MKKKNTRLPKAELKQNVPVSMSENMLDAVDEAAGPGRRSQFIRSAIQEKLDKKIKENSKI